MSSYESDRDDQGEDAGKRENKNSNPTGPQEYDSYEGPRRGFKCRIEHRRHFVCDGMVNPIYMRLSKECQARIQDDKESRGKYERPSICKTLLHVPYLLCQRIMLSSGLNYSFVAVCCSMLLGVL